MLFVLLVIITFIIIILFYFILFSINCVQLLSSVCSLTNNSNLAHVFNCTVLHNFLNLQILLMCPLMFSLYTRFNHYISQISILILILYIYFRCVLYTCFYFWVIILSQSIRIVDNPLSIWFLLRYSFIVFIKCLLSLSALSFFQTTFS